VLARMLDDGTFGILNGFVFFTQVDIINYIQNNDQFLHELLSGFQDDRPSTPDPNNLPPLDEHRRDIVLLLNQLMILGKGVQLPSRLALYRNLLDRGLLYAVEWALRRTEAQLLHAGAEILTLVVDLDVSAVRMHVLKEDEMKRRSLIVEMIRLLGTTKNIGLLSQVGESLRNLLETTIEESVGLDFFRTVVSSNPSRSCNGKRDRYRRTSSFRSTKTAWDCCTSR
jgi:protein phosphatase-4 regulatory subunit 3